MQKTLKKIQSLIKKDTESRINKLQEDYDQASAKIKDDAEQMIQQEHINYNIKIIQSAELLLSEKDKGEVIEKITDSVLNKREGLQKLVDDANEHLTELAEQLDRDKEDAMRLKQAVDDVISKMEKAQAKAVVTRA
jgi:ribosomal protein S4